MDTILFLAGIDTPPRQRSSWRITATIVPSVETVCPRARSFPADISFICMLSYNLCIAVDNFVRSLTSFLLRHIRFCIRSWLEHHSSCPTCRRSLASKTESEAQEDRQEASSTPMGHSQGRDPEDDRNTLSQRRDLVSSSAMSGTSTSTMALTPMGTPSGSSTATSSSAHSGSSTPVNPPGRSRAVGHQLFAFNSEQQPWLTRLGFPRITLEVVDRAEEGEEERGEDTRHHGHHYHHGDSQHTQNYTHPSQPPTHTSRNETSRRSREIQESIYSDDDDEYNEELARALRESLAMHEMLVAAREAAAAAAEEGRGKQEPELERGQGGEGEANMRRRHYPSEHLSLP